MMLKPKKQLANPSYPSKRDFRKAGLVHLAVAATIALGHLVVGCRPTRLAGKVRCPNEQAIEEKGISDEQPTGMGGETGKAE